MNPLFQDPPLSRPATHRSSEPCATTCRLGGSRPSSPSLPLETAMAQHRGRERSGQYAEATMEPVAFSRGLTSDGVNGLTIDSITWNPPLIDTQDEERRRQIGRMVHPYTSLESPELGAFQSHSWPLGACHSPSCSMESSCICTYSRAPWEGI